MLWYSMIKIFGLTEVIVYFCICWLICGRVGGLAKIDYSAIDLQSNISLDREFNICVLTAVVVSHWVGFLAALPGCLHSPHPSPLLSFLRNQFLILKYGAVYVIQSVKCRVEFEFIIHMLFSFSCLIVFSFFICHYDFGLLDWEYSFWSSHINIEKLR